jgi:hypothetical protein
LGESGVEVVVGAANLSVAHGDDAMLEPDRVGLPSVAGVAGGAGGGLARVPAASAS